MTRGPASSPSVGNMRQSAPEKETPACSRNEGTSSAVPPSPDGLPLVVAVGRLSGRSSPGGLPVGPVRSATPGPRRDAGRSQNPCGWFPRRARPGGAAVQGFARTVPRLDTDTVRTHPLQVCLASLDEAPIRSVYGRHPPRSATVGPGEDVRDMTGEIGQQEAGKEWTATRNAVYGSSRDGGRVLVFAYDVAAADREALGLRSCPADEAGCTGAVVLEAGEAMGGTTPVAAAGLDFPALVHQPGHKVDGSMARPTGGVCERTPEVRIALTAAVGAASCAGVTTAALGALTGTLDLASQGIGTLAAGDFTGLRALTGLDLSGNPGTFLPAVDAGADLAEQAPGARVALAGTTTGPWVLMATQKRRNLANTRYGVDILERRVLANPALHLVVSDARCSPLMRGFTPPLTPGARTWSTPGSAPTGHRSSR